MTIKKGLTSLSLYSGAGGLDVGLEAAGFSNSLCVEIDACCKETLARNRPLWKQASPGDIHKINFDTLLEQAGLSYKGELDLLSGGPPCQPFSKSGYWVNGDARRLDDPRASTLDAYLKVIDYALPKAFLLENVKGLAYKDKDEGLQFLISQLKLINKKHNCNYQLSYFHLNCVRYGVPQLRERIFIVGSREGIHFCPPAPTHFDTEDTDTNTNRLRYLNAWDAIGDLDLQQNDEELALSGKWADLLPTIPEGKNYQWHTPGGGGFSLFGRRTRYWSFLLKLAKNQPSWTIQAGPGPATGPFHWNNRKLSIREMARIQTFPDDYKFFGSYRSVQRQIGNAVPPAIGYLLGVEIRKQIFRQSAKNLKKFIPSPREDCPSPERRARLPQKYNCLIGDHAEHPGVGLGPGVKKELTT